MNVYVETNFVLELALLQEQHKACEQILTLCETGKVHLVLPAYSVSEPYETLIRRHKNRKRLKEEMDTELRQLARTSSYTPHSEGFRAVVDLLVKSTEEEAKRLEETRDRLIKAAEIIPLEREVLLTLTFCQKTYGLSPQDATVYASVVRHLDLHPPSNCCFLNKNSRDFDDPDIVDALAKYGCTMLASFNAAYDFIRHEVGS